MRKVIDIVLIPDEGIQRICREVNQDIGGKIDFVKTGKIPHISLMMGAVDESNLQELFEILSQIGEKIPTIELTGSLKKYAIGNTGEIGYSYELDKNLVVQELFSEICKKIRPKLEYNNLSQDMFYMPEEVEKQSIIWVEGFRDKGLEEYSSHITLGIGELTQEYANRVHFSAPQLAIYQLGNYCTCENKLFQLDL